MKRYHVCRHPDGTLQTVKEGFSWPGLVFGGVWLLYRRVFLTGTIALASGALAYAFVPSSSLSFGLADVINLVICVVVGVQGNAWVLDQLAKRGYECVATVTAATPDGARAQYLLDQARTGGVSEAGVRRETTF